MVDGGREEGWLFDFDECGRDEDGLEWWVEGGLDGGSFPRSYNSLFKNIFSLGGTAPLPRDTTLRWLLGVLTLAW